VAVWRSGFRINEVTLRPAGLVLRLVSVTSRFLVFNQATQANLAFHPSWVGISSTGLLGWGEGGARSPVPGDRDSLWQVTSRRSEMCSLRAINTFKNKSWTLGPTPAGGEVIPLFNLLSRRKLIAPLSQSYYTELRHWLYRHWISCVVEHVAFP